MAEKKLIIEPDKITEVIYIGSNLHAKGGKKKKKKRLLDDKRSDYTYDVLGRQMHEKQITVGKYHVKNYNQRNNERIDAVKKLIEYNFQPGKCMMITLHFSNKPNSADTAPTSTISETNTENSNIEKCNTSPFIDFDKLDLFNYTEPFELDLVKISNDLFSTESSNSIQTVYSESIYTDLKTCNKEFKKFIQKLNYRFDNFKYVAVMSRQENGNWHYHMVCNLDYIAFDELKDLWNIGGVYIGKVYNSTQLEKVKNYAIKNMRKSRYDLKGYDGYLASKKGLTRKIEFRSWVSSDQEEFKKHEQRLEQAKNKGSYIKRHINEHKYSGYTRNDKLFSEKKELSCTFKYYTYRVQSIKYFNFLDTAQRKKN